jgi:hypothetical protein
MEEMNCPNCGSKIFENEKFCIRCGTPRPLENELPPPSPIPSVQMQVKNDAAVQRPIVPIVLFTVSCVLLLGALVFAGYKFVFGRQDTLGQPVNAVALDTTASKVTENAGLPSATPAISESEEPMAFPSETDTAAATTSDMDTQPPAPSTTPSPAPSPSTTPSPAPASSSPSVSPSSSQTPSPSATPNVVYINDILNWKTDKQAVAAFGEPKSRKNVEYDDADGVVLVYDGFKIEFYTDNGKVDGFSALTITSNQVPIEVYSIAVGMTVSEAKAGLADAGYKAYSSTKTLINSYNASTHTYIYIYLKDSMITKIWAG